MSKFVHFFSRFYFERSKDQSFAVKINQREPKRRLKIDTLVLKHKTNICHNSFEVNKKRIGVNWWTT